LRIRPGVAAKEEHVEIAGPGQIELGGLVAQQLLAALKRFAQVLHTRHARPDPALPLPRANGPDHERDTPLGLPHQAQGLAIEAERRHAAADVAQRGQVLLPLHDDGVDTQRAVQHGLVALASTKDAVQTPPRQPGAYGHDHQGHQHFNQGETAAPQGQAPKPDATSGTAHFNSAPAR
jgi:hypothetical protein